MEVFERDSQILGGNCRQTVRRSNLKDHPRADQAAGIVQHMAKRLLEVRIERCRQRKARAKGIREGPCLYLFNAFSHLRSDPRHSFLVEDLPGAGRTRLCSSNASCWMHHCGLRRKQIDFGEQDHISVRWQRVDCLQKKPLSGIGLAAGRLKICRNAETPESEPRCLCQNYPDCYQPPFSFFCCFDQR